MSEAQRDAVWEKLPERLAPLSSRVRLLPWIREELVDWIRDSIVARQGAWIVGVPGAVAEFPSAGTDPINVRVEAGVVTAVRSDAAFRIGINEKVRAFAFTDGGSIVLGLPKGRAELPRVSALQLVGPDSGAIDEAHRCDLLFDMGIGRRYTRFFIRTNNVRLITAFSKFDRRPWTGFLPAVEDQLNSVSPHRVVESAAARIEVYSRTPSGDASSPNGANIPILPEFLESGEEIAASLALPDYAAPIAIYRPNKS